MTFFDTSEVADFADLVTEASPDTAVIKRNQGTTSDGYGGTVDDWQTVATVPAKVSMGEATPTEQTVGYQQVGVMLMLITVPSGTDVRPSDRIEVGSTVYEVVGLTPPRSFEARRRVIVRSST